MKLHNEFFNIKSDKIDQNKTISLLSDIHNTLGASFDLYEKVSDEIKQTNPQIILICGDLVYNADDFFDKNNEKRLHYLLNLFRDIAPVIISIGNHDITKGTKYSKDDSIKYLKSLEKKSNIHILDNETIINNDLSISGFNPRLESYFQRYNKKWKMFFIEDFLSSDFEFDDNKFNIFMCHSPLIISQKEVLEMLKQELQNIDLIVSGHLHDGYIPRKLQNTNMFSNGNGFEICTDYSNIFGSRISYCGICRGEHDLLNSKLIVSRGLRKIVLKNKLASYIDDKCTKDITTIKLQKKL